jgi:hypothetical protein
MEKLLLGAKHWQLFLIFCAACATNYYATTATMVTVSTIALLVSGVGWYVLIGNMLYHHLPRNTYYSITWFLLDALLVLATYAASIILFNGKLELTGLAGLVGLYMFFAIGHLSWLPAVELVAIETKGAPSFARYAGTWIQFAIWPLGIWFIQPRLNQIYSAT